MNFISLILIILGLSLFEIISSIDNAIVNADVLSKMSEKYRKWFLIWGIIFAVFIIRGVLPLIIFWLANPSLSIIDSFRAVFSDDPKIVESLEKSSPLLFISGGIFLLFLFLHWLFLEPKEYGLKVEEFFNRQGVWFFAITSIFLTFIIWFALQKNHLMAFSAAVGSSFFFIVHGFKEYAQKLELEMINQNSRLSDLSKLLYLEALDATFSIDGVIGAFAFTLFVPLIILGNGIGALVVRQLTIKGIDNIRKYIYLKNGAMYSIFFLSLLMIIKSFGIEIPEYVSPIVSFIVIGYFFFKSKLELMNNNLN